MVELKNTIIIFVAHGRSDRLQSYEATLPWLGRSSKLQVFDIFFTRNL